MITLEQLQTRRAELAANLENSKAQTNQLAGAVAVLEQLIAEWPKTEPIVEESPE